MIRYSPSFGRPGVLRCSAWSERRFIRVVALTFNGRPRVFLHLCFAASPCLPFILTHELTEELDLGVRCRHARLLRTTAAWPQRLLRGFDLAMSSDGFARDFFVASFRSSRYLVTRA